MFYFIHLRNPLNFKLMFVGLSCGQWDRKNAANLCGFHHSLEAASQPWNLKRDWHNAEEEDVVGWKEIARKRRCIALVRVVAGGLPMERE